MIFHFSVIQSFGRGASNFRLRPSNVKVIQFTARNISLRLMAGFCLAAGIVAAWFMDRPEESVPTSIPVRVSADQPIGGGASGGREWPAVFADRDPADYEIGPEAYDCVGEKDPYFSRCLAEREEARQFVLSHWKSRRSAYVAVHFPCADCDPVHHILVEPDANGVWRILTMHEDRRFGFSDRGTAFGVRSRRTRDEEKRRDPSANRLSFLDRSGREIDSF
jgi:hypothetical protein